MLDQANNFEMIYQPHFILHFLNEYDKQLQCDMKTDQKVSTYFEVIFQLLFEEKIEIDGNCLNLATFVVVVK